MPLGRVIENFDPDGPRFDVVIVDESSQADTFGLLALMRAERAVVVGDDNQISPAAVGQRRDIVDQLIDRHLDGIPNFPLYDGQQSLYDLATAAFGGVIHLREHFRCVPEIIGFSNALCYQGEIRPLRDPTSTALVPPVVLHRVSGYRGAGSDVNEEEARWIAALIAACCEHSFYKESTLGAISMLGEGQARLILEYVRAVVSPEELDRRAFIAGDAYHFQGDERDVMFLSLVEAPGERRPAVLNRRPDQQRFNVAASRARDQMWIVHSVDAAHFHAEDMRARLLTHYLHRDDRDRNWRDVSQVLSQERYYFQRLVAQQLIQRGYRVRAEVPVGQYRIDLVVDGENESLAVECDGERWHTLDTQRDDVARQMTLERLGWEFFRVRGGHYFRDPESALTPLWRRLDELGITRLLANRSATIPRSPARFFGWRRNWWSEAATPGVTLKPPDADGAGRARHRRLLADSLHGPDGFGCSAGAERTFRILAGRRGCYRSGVPDRIEDILQKFPDGMCTACLARRSGRRHDDVEEIVDGFLIHLRLRVHDGICPRCGAVRRIVRIV